MKTEFLHFLRRANRRLNPSLRNSREFNIIFPLEYVVSMLWPDTSSIQICLQNCSASAAGTSNHFSDDIWEDKHKLWPVEHKCSIDYRLGDIPVSTFERRTSTTFRLSPALHLWDVLIHAFPLWPCWAVNKGSWIIFWWNRCTNFSASKWRTQWGHGKFVQNLCDFYAYRGQVIQYLWTCHSIPVVFSHLQISSFITWFFLLHRPCSARKNLHVQTSFLFKSVACDNLWTIFIRWWFHPLSISVCGRHWNTWKVCKICFEWLTLKGGVCVGIAKNRHLFSHGFHWNVSVQIP